MKWTKGLKDKKALEAFDAEALRKELKAAQKDLYVLNMKHLANELKQPHLLKVHRAYIARLNTYINAN